MAPVHAALEGGADKALAWLEAEAEFLHKAAVSEATEHDNPASGLEYALIADMLGEHVAHMRRVLDTARIIRAAFLASLAEKAAA